MTEETKPTEYVLKPKERPQLQLYAMLCCFVDCVLQRQEYGVALSHRLSEPVRIRLDSRLPLSGFELDPRIGAIDDRAYDVKIARFFDWREVDREAPDSDPEPFVYCGKFRVVATGVGHRAGAIADVWYELEELPRPTREESTP